MNRTLLAAVNLKEEYTLTPGGEPVSAVYGTPADLINTIMPNLFTFVGIMLIIFIFVAGFRMATNPDDKSAKDSGKKSLTLAVTGFLLLFASYWIIQIVEFYTGISILGGRN